MQKNIIRSFEDIYEKVKGARVTLTVSVIHPHYIEIIKAIKKATEAKLCNFALVGDKTIIEKLLEEQNVDITNIGIFDEKEESQACKKGIELIRKGNAHILMKGDVKTSTLLKAVLDKEEGLRTGNFLSHIYVAWIPSYHKLIFMSDGGLAISPTLVEKISIIKNAVEFVKTLGIDLPKIALLCASEVVNPDMVETIDAHNIVNMQKEKILDVDAIIEGPVALDVAISAEAARIKKINSAIAGDTDIFIVPNISSGNIFGKALIYFGGAKAAGIVWGAKVPIALLSRADDWETKFRSLLLSLIAKQH